MNQTSSRAGFRVVTNVIFPTAVSCRLKVGAHYPGREMTERGCR